MSQDARSHDHQHATDRSGTLDLQSSLEALQASPEFRGPAEALDGHYCNDHLALIYEDEAEQFASIVPFVRQGLQRGERCMYVIDDLSETDVHSALREAGVDVDGALESGALSFHEVEDTYLRSGTFDPDEMIEFYAAAIEEATEEYEALRVTAETTWLQEDETTIEDFMEYEAKVNELFEDEDCIALCQYDREAFDPAVVHDIVRTHPHLIYEGTVCHNFYHTPPAEFFGPDRPGRQVDRMLGTVVDRTQAKATLAERERFQREFNDITADRDRSFEEKLQALFELGCERFDLEYGGVGIAKVEADQYEVEYASEDCPFDPGSQFPLAETYCAETVAGGGVMSVVDPEREGYDDVAIYEEYGLRTYMGACIAVEGSPDRSFFFGSTEARDDPFSDDEQAFQRLMGQWVKSELERLQRERQLQRQREYTDDLLDAIDDVFYVLDEDGTLQRYNESLRAVSGYPEAELESKNCLEFFEGEDVEDVAEGITEVCENGTARVQAEFVTRDGEAIPYEFVASALEDPAGNQVLTGIGRDVSERVEREAELRKQRDRFASLFESIPEPVVHAPFEDGEPVVSDVNSAFESTFGYDVDQLVGDPLNDHIVPPGREAEARQIDSRASEQEYVSREVRRETADGMRDFLLGARQFEREDGTIEGLGVYVDVTERKERERELELFRNLIDHSNDGVFVIEPDTGRILDVNDTACRRLGYDRDELLDRSVPDIEQRLSDLEEWRDHVEDVRAEGGLTFEGEQERKDGTTFPVEINVVHVELDRPSIIAIARDVTDRKERERTLRELYETTADTELSFEEKVDRLLEFGCDRFGFEYGLLTRIAGDRLEIVDQAGDQGELGAGSTVPLSETYCRKVHRSSEPMGVVDATEEGWAADDAYQSLGFESYLGTAVTHGNGAHGTLSFASKTPRERSFTAAEYTFLELMGQWMSYELEREHRVAQFGALNRMSRDLMDAKSLAEIADRTVEHARSSLKLPLTAFVSYDEETGTLSAAARTPRADDELPTAALCDPGSGELWDAFVANETRLLDDVSAVAGAGDDLTEVLAIPLGRDGMFVTATRATDGFSDAELDFVETTALTIESACDRSERERQLQERERTLEEQNETLERLNRVNDIIRSIDQALVGASTRDEIEAVVCEQLADVGPYELAWIAEHDPVTGAVTPRESAGTAKGYLDGITITTDDGPGGRGPTGTALRTREPQVANDILGDRSYEPWRQKALNRGYHASISLPLVYEDTLYGALNVYAGQPGVFDELKRSVLAELSDNIAYAINAVESKKALVSDQVAELEFEVRDTGIAAVDLAMQTGCSFTWQSLVPRSDGGFRGFFTTRGTDADTVLSFVDDLPVGDVTLIAEREEGGERICLFEILLTDESFCGYVLEHGGNPRTIRVVDGVATIIIELAADAPLREFVEAFQTRYPDSELVAQRTREREQHTPTEFHIALTDELTTRQREALETAYFSGYFERPRDRTGSEIAEAMDISQPTFNHHLRAAHRKLCHRLFETEQTTV